MMDRIGDTRLYVGDYHDSLTKADAFDTVVNVSQRTVLKDNLIHIPLDDHNTPQRQFEHAVDVVLDRLEQGEKVLLHCKVGVNRSPSVAIAALGRLEELSFQDAYDLVLEHRTVASPGERNKELAAAAIEGEDVGLEGTDHSDLYLGLTGIDARVRRFLWKLVH